LLFRLRSRFAGNVREEESVTHLMIGRHAAAPDWLQVGKDSQDLEAGGLQLVQQLAAVVADKPEKAAPAMPGGMGGGGMDDF